MEENYNNAQNYINRINAEKKAAQELTTSALNAEKILAQLNNKSNKQVYGKAAQYKKQLATCKFKLVAYFNQNKLGSFYTQVEKDQNQHRQYIPSLDYLYSGGRSIINHKIAHVALIDYCLQNANRLDKACLIVNDWIKKEEQMIFIFNPKNIALSQYVDPYFKEDPATGGIFFDGLDGAPFRVDKMRFYNNL